MTSERIAELRDLANDPDASFLTVAGFGEALDALEASQTQIAALRKALEPFAAWSRRLTGPNQLGDACPLSVEPAWLADTGQPTVADLHAAARALGERP